MTRRNSIAPLMLASLLSACHGDGSEPTPGTDTDAGTAADAGTHSGQLVINEVSAASSPDWVELYNDSAQTIDLRGMTFTDDRSMPTKGRFTASAPLAPGAFLKVEVSDDLTAFSLSGDEEFALFSSTGTQVDLVDWNDGDSPKDKSVGRFPDGTGAFKTLNTPSPGAANLDNGVCGNGTAERDEPCDGADLHGATCTSLGYVSGTLACGATCQLFTQRCVQAAADIVLNELTSSGDDSIELYNRGAAEVDLKDWYVADRDYDPATGPEDKRYLLKTSLAAKQYLVLVKGKNHSFGIGKAASSLRLFNKANQLLDTATWATGAAETSFCRKPNGTGDFTACAAPSFGAANP